MISYEDVILIWIVTAVVSAVASGVFYSYKARRKVSYILDALEDKETNFRFDEKTLFYRKYHRTLNRIRTIFEKERQEINEQERYYGQMLDRVKTGIVVVEQNKKFSGRILYCNSAALNIIGVATLGNVRQLGNISPELQSCFENISDANNEMRISFYNEKGQTTLSVTYSKTSLQGKEVKIFVLNDISNDISHNEELSWNRLIRVLTHEIMNTVTPIASLSHTLSADIASAGNDKSVNREELQMGLDTISESARGLIKFVNTYRSLTRISTPVKKAFFVRDLIDRVRNLTRNQIAEAGAEFKYMEKTEDILLYADEDQIAQVIVNLVRNALQANASQISVTAEINCSETVLINVSNNGQPINKENHEDIFVPFYTTKQEGTGIGLSLSRQIMRLHNGSISLVCSNDKVTTFLLQFK